MSAIEKAELALLRIKRKDNMEKAQNERDKHERICQVAEQIRKFIGQRFSHAQIDVAPLNPGYVAYIVGDDESYIKATVKLMNSKYRITNAKLMMRDLTVLTIEPRSQQGDLSPIEFQLLMEIVFEQSNTQDSYQAAIDTVKAIIENKAARAELAKIYSEDCND